MERGCKCKLSKRLTSVGMTESKWELVASLFTLWFLSSSDNVRPPSGRTDRLASSSRQTSVGSRLQVLGLSNDAREQLLTQSFVILVYCQHTDNPVDTLHLKSPLDDLDLMMRYIRRVPTATQSQVYVLTDLPTPNHESWIEYRKINDTNARRETLATIQEASQKNASGVIFYGGHGGRDDCGAYLLPRPGNKIYGKDIVPLLPDQTDSTVGLVLDACHMDTFFDRSAVPCLMTMNDGIATRSGSPGARRGGQLIVISAAREGQNAHSVRLKQARKGCSHGVLLVYLMHHIRKYRTKGIDPSKLIADVQPVGAQAPPNPQEPFIASRHPVTPEDFLRLPMFHL